MSPIWQVMTRIKRQRVGRLLNSLLEMHLQYPLTAQSITMASSEINHHLTLINGRKSNNRTYIWKWLISQLIPTGKTLSCVAGDRVVCITSLPCLPWRNYYSNSEPRNRYAKQEDLKKFRFVFLNQSVQRFTFKLKRKEDTRGILMWTLFISCMMLHFKCWQWNNSDRHWMLLNFWKGNLFAA